MPIRLPTALVAATLTVGIVAGCGAISGQDPTNQSDVCDGVGRSVGGCDADQPTFSGETCLDVAGEFGRQLDERVVAILRGDDIVDGEHKSVRMAHQQALLVSRVNQHLRSGAVDQACPAEKFLDDAELEFTPELRETAGDFLFGSGPRPYEEWRADLLKTLGAIEVDLGSG
jgi:hypothetical protein